MKNILIICCLVFLGQSTSARQLTLSDSLISARDIYAAKMAYAYLTDREHQDSGTVDGWKIEHYEDARRALAINRYGIPIPNDEAYKKLIKEGFYELAKGFIKPVGALHIHARDRAKLPRLMLKQLFAVDSEVSHSPTCIAYKDKYRIGLKRYFNIPESEKDIQYAARIQTAIDYVAGRLTYSNLRDFVNNDPAASDSDRQNFSRIKSYLSANTLIHPANPDSLITQLQKNGFRSFTIFLLPNLRLVQPDIDDAAGPSEIASILVNRIYEFPGRFKKNALCLALKDSLIEELGSYFEDPSGKQNPTEAEDSHTAKRDAFWKNGTVTASVLILSIAAILFLRLRRKSKLTSTAGEHTFSYEKDSIPTERSIPATNSHDAEVFFIGLPRPGQPYFYENGKSASLRPDKFFKFTKTGKETALFELVNKDHVLKLLESDPHIFDQIVDFISIPPGKLININVVNEGLAILKGNKWQVSVKARCMIDGINKIDDQQPTNEEVNASSGDSAKKEGSAISPDNIHKFDLGLPDGQHFQQKEPLPHTIQSTFYLPFTDDSNWPDDRKTEQKQDNSMFMLVIDKHNTSKASFQLINEHRILALVKEDILIKNGCCVARNVYPGKFSGIKILEAGIVTLTNKKWGIVSPIVFSFNEAKHLPVQPANQTVRDVAEQKEKIGKQPVATRVSTTLPVNPQQLKFYMGLPDGDLFSAKLKSAKQLAGKSVFEFRYIDDKEADFRILSTPHTRSLTQDTYYLEKIIGACECTHYPSAETTDIITMRSGRARLEGNGWRIVQKVLITFVPASAQDTKEEMLAVAAPALVAIPGPQIVSDDSEYDRFYMSFPDGKVFADATKSPICTANSNFEFLRAENSMTALYRVLHNDELRRIISNRQLYKLASACDFPADYSDDVLDIEFGEVMLIAGFWKITKKTKITFT